MGKKTVVKSGEEIVVKIEEKTVVESGEKNYSGELGGKL